jgi:spore germination protein YaaH
MKKILLGLPFHGAMFELDDKSPRYNPLTAKAFSEMLQGDFIGEMTWDQIEKENLYTFNVENKNYITTFPSNKFFKERLEFCIENKLGGVGIWDVAQGYDIFLDEF